MSEFENENINELESAAETASETVEEVTGTAVEPVEEAAPVRKTAVHMTASAAALNAEGEVDIRRRKPREVKQIKQSKISYERKKGL